MKKLSALLMAVCTLVALAPESLAVPSDGTTSTALLTEAKGTVYKRSFIDWSKQQWGEPTSAKAGDSLQEGMQVGTGDKSWAQIAWQYVTCRAWANSVYAVAPHQRLVYLSSGEMLFHLDKNRKDKDKDQYCIWTNLLQARVRGTTVLVQATADTSKLTVLEGTVDVLNKLDHSVVRIKPGVVYTIQAKADQLPRNVSSAEIRSGNTVDAIQRALNAPAVPTEVLPNTAPIASTVTESGKPLIPGAVSTVEHVPQELTNIIANKQGVISLFDNAKSTTQILIANADALLAHPLVTGLESELSSLPLVKESLSSLPATLHEGLGNLEAIPLRALGAPGTENSIVSSAAEILRVPTRTSYDVGPSVGSVIHIAPVAAALFPPSAVIGSASAMSGPNFVERTANGLNLNQAGHKVLSLQDPLFRLPISQALLSPQLPGGANLPGASAGPGGSLAIANSVLLTRAGGIVGITPATSAALLNGTLGSAVGVTGINGLTNSVLVRGANGQIQTVQLSNLTGALGTTVTQTVGGVGGIVTNLGGTVTNLGGTLGGTLGGVVGGLGGTVTNLGGTVNNLGGTLGGTLGGLLGH